MLTTRLGADLVSAWKGVRGGGLGSLVAVAALALGIGASTTASTVAYGGLLRPLPLPDDSQLITLEKVFGPTGLAEGIKLDEFDGWRDKLASTATLAAFTGERVTIRSGGGAQDARAGYVVGHWFQMLGAQPLAGRLIDDPGDVGEAVASQAFAERQGAAAPAAILGRTFTIGGRPVRVVGVLPASFSIIDEADLWTLARGVSGLEIGGSKDARLYRMVARVAPDRSINAARATASAALASLVGDTKKAMWQVRVQPLRERLLGDSRSVLLAFLGSSVLVLLAACANVAMLLVNRAIARAREFSVRVALGASPGRLLAVATLETAILAAAGTAGGWWLARTASLFVRSSTGLELPAVATRPSEAAVAIAAVLAGALVIAFSAAVPLIAYNRAVLSGSLRTATATGSRASRRLRGGLVAAQLAMTVVLLTGAGLLGRTLLAVSRADLGLTATEHVVSMNVPLGETLDPSNRPATVQRLLDDTRRLPGVVSAGFGGALPPVQPGLVFTVRVTTSERTVDATRAFDLVPVTDGYFEALGARVLEGRTFTPGDILSAAPICVLSESAAKHLQLVVHTVVGRQLNMGLPSANGPRVKPVVVGVIKDIRYSGLDAPAHGGVYVPWRQLPLGSAFLVARTTSDPASLSPTLTRLVHDIDPSIPIRPPLTLDNAVSRAAAPRAARFTLVGVFAAGAALLAVVGLSGALIRSVIERQRELAVRAAIGATPRQLLREVLRHGMALTLIGVIAGLGISAALGRGMSSIVYGVPARDPLTYVVTAAAVLAVATVACLWPARRAAAADPVLLLRAE
jgi:putative ABC transport system permease protein